MTAKQIEASETNDRYYVVRVTMGPSQVFEIRDRTTGGLAAKNVGRVTFATMPPADSKAKRLNKGRN